MTFLGNCGPRSKSPHWTKQFMHTSQSHARIRKIPVQAIMTHVVKIDILTGHEEIGYLHFNPQIIFHCILRYENEKGLCAYILYMHITPSHSQTSIFIEKKACIFSKLIQSFV